MSRRRNPRRLRDARHASAEEAVAALVETKQTFRPRPDRHALHAARLALYREHMASVQEMWGEKAGYRQVRLYSFYYFGRFPIPGLRPRLGSTKSCAELFSLLEEFEREALERGVELIASSAASLPAEVA